MHRARHRVFRCKFQTQHMVGFDGVRGSLGRVLVGLMVWFAVADMVGWLDEWMNETPKSRLLILLAH